MKFDNLATNATKITNHEGAEAYAMSAEMELYTAVVTSSLSPVTYESVNKRVERIAQLVEKCDPEFVAQLAVYARTRMYLRSVPLLLAVELAKNHNGDNLVSRLVSRIVLRADEIMELLACYQWRNAAINRPDSRKGLACLSRQIQAGLQQAFNRFDEYQFAKYDSDSRAVKLRDALFLVHPKAKSPEQQAIFDRIASRSLATPYTWETELSALGQQTFDSEALRNAAFANKWNELILSGRLGYMALLRNLRNILTLPCTHTSAMAEAFMKVGDRLGLTNTSNDAMKTAIGMIADRDAVLASKQLPFRFLSAYREIKGVNSLWTSAMLEALEQAVRHSAENIQGFDCNTSVVIASDVSGSMYSPVSRNSKVMLYDIGLMLSMLLRSRCQKVITGIFGDRWMELNFPAGNILANVNNAASYEGRVGYSTNGYKVIDDLIERSVAVDKVMMFTDCQMWDSYYDGKTLVESWHRYKREVAPQAKLYLFDLAGYGQSPISLAERDVYLIAGWSDKVFDILAAIERGSSALAEIKKIEV